MAEFVVLWFQLYWYLPTRQTSLISASAAGSASVLRIRCGRRGGRAGARKSRRNPGVTTCHYQGTATSHVLLDQCSGEREREKDRVWPTQWQANGGGPSCACTCSSSVVASGGWCRDHWLLREEREGARKAQVKPTFWKMPCCSKQSMVH